MTWDDFYEYYYDWDETTRIKNLFSVVWLGPSDEVCEIICELAFRHKDAANRLAGKALAQKIVFSAEEIQDLAGTIDDRLLEKLLWQAADSYSEKDLEFLHYYENQLERAPRKNSDISSSVPVLLSHYST